MSGADLKRLRLQMGLTQEALAKLLGIHRNVYGRYERAKEVWPPMWIAVNCLANHRRPGR